MNKISTVLGEYAKDQGFLLLKPVSAHRTKTKRRILNKIKQNKLDLLNGKISEEYFSQSLQSYLGVLKHCKGYKIEKKILKIL